MRVNKQILKILSLTKFISEGLAIVIDLIRNQPDFDPVNMNQLYEPVLDSNGVPLKSVKIIQEVLFFGQYFQQLVPFFQEFSNMDQFHFVDGGSLISDTENEFGLLQDFLGVEEELKFKFNPDKSFNCLQKPVPMCLSNAKGK